MKTKWHWGWNIGLVYGGFVGMILTLVMMSMGVKTDLVADDYYAQELRYQQKIEKRQRAQALDERLQWKVSERRLEFRFPGNLETRGLGGQVHFYCPADRGRDRTVPLGTKAVQQIPLSGMQPGRYKIQVDWHAGDVTFWDEGVILI